ncbi:MAG TPA: gamma-glutamyl-gamma-aminobutyrate hydrolase family protein [Burkholderiales bacterium]|nr:gamma-glutamyl-gamma-aminobutyrate hydrolase family protein [Burkholderiales bacterium]
MTIHVVQHTSAEFLGLIEDHLEGRGIRFRYCRPFTGKVPLPKPDALDQGLVLLGGGPWGSAGTRDVPTLSSEVELAKACLREGKPIVGIGLGAQILALAAGGNAQKNELEFSVGVAKRVKPAALEGYLPPEYPLAVYMRDWPLPPPGAEVLAVDAKGRAALWQLDSRALGFAGHPGLKVAMVEDLVMEFEEVAPDADAGLAALRAAQRGLEDALVPIMVGVVKLMHWMD